MTAISPPPAKNGLENDVYVIVEELLSNNITPLFPSHHSATFDGFTLLKDVHSQLIAADFDVIEKDLKKALMYISDQKLAFSGKITMDNIIVGRVSM